MVRSHYLTRHSKYIALHIVQVLSYPLQVGAELINALLKSAKIETPSWSDLDDGHLESHNSRSFDFLQKSKQRMTEGHVVDDRRQQQVLGASEPAFQHYFALDEDTPSNRFKVGFVEIKEAALKQLLEGHMVRAY